MLLGLFALLHPGCSGGADDDQGTESELARALGLASGARIHRVTLGGRGTEEHAVPSLIEAGPGDAVEFLTVDHRVHTVVFPFDSLAPEVLGFLQRSDQGASPPLVHRGSRFILQLEGAPLGRYPFESEGHGGIARGVILVSAPADSLPSNRR